MTITDTVTAISVSATSTYEYYALIGAQPALGVQGCQFGIQCSVAGATVAGVIRGFQATTADKSSAQTSQGVTNTTPFQMVAGYQMVELAGVITTPSGSPAIGVQVKGVQASQAWYIKPNSYLRLTKTS